MYARIVIVCQACRSPDIEIIEYTSDKPTTDIEIKYFKVHCPHCHNYTHNATILSGLDIVKLEACAKEI
jgi:Zn finger protein HypA/HybF involved in hydrogenase expression